MAAMAGQAQLGATNMSLKSFYAILAITQGLLLFEAFYLGCNRGYELGVKVGHAEEQLRGSCLLHNGSKE